MKKIAIALYALLITAAIALLGYQLVIEKNFDTGFLLKGGLCVLALVTAMIRHIFSVRKPAANQKTLYQKAYAQYITNAFQDDDKLEKRLYRAIDDYNNGKPGAAITKLEKLRSECTRTNELYAVTVFTALCLDEVQLYDQAVTQYDAALKIRSSSSLYSNMGLCHQRLGHFDEAEHCYDLAVSLDPKNAYALNNLSALYFKIGNYDEALDTAVEAIAIDPKLPQALSTAAICCGLLGYNEDYEKYYRQAVANGYDGRKIKNCIRNLDPEL